MQTPDPVIRPAAPGDLDAVAAIFSHYVTSSVITFEATPPNAGDWRRTRDDLTARGLPFLVCECDGEVACQGHARSPRARSCPLTAWLEATRTPNWPGSVQEPVTEATAQKTAARLVDPGAARSTHQ